jgi:hypothetical protein
MTAGTVRKTLPMEFGQLQRALTITSAGYAEPPAPAAAMTAAGVGSAGKVGVVIESHPEIMIQPIAPAGQTAASTVFHLPEQAVPQPEQVLTGVAFGQVYEA